MRQIDNAARLAREAAERAEACRLEDPRATLACIHAEMAADKARWLLAVARRIEDDAAKHPRRKIPVLEGLAIAAEQALELARTSQVCAEAWVRKAGKAGK
jgi:hypothetical protein